MKHKMNSTHEIPIYKKGYIFPGVHKEDLYFGLKNAFSIFQSVMDNILPILNNNFWLVYVDDVVLVNIGDLLKMSQELVKLQHHFLKSLSSMPTNIFLLPHTSIARLSKEFILTTDPHKESLEETDR